MNSNGSKQVAGNKLIGKNDEANRTNQTTTENDEIDPSDQKFTYFQMFCFAIAGFAFQVMASAIAVFSTKFLLDEVKILPTYTTIVYFLGKTVDAVTDPIYGHFVTLSKFTRFGKNKPWIATSLPLTVICYFMMWYSPFKGDPGDIRVVVWFTCFYCAYFTFITGYRIPHTSMTMCLSKSKAKREMATVIRMALEMSGILVSILLHTVIIGDASENCINITIPVQNTTGSYRQTNKIVQTELSFFKQYKYQIAAAIVVFIYIVSQLMLLIFVSEQNTTVVSGSKSPVGQANTLQGLKLVFTFKPFLLLTAATTCTLLAQQIVQTYLQLYFEYAYTDGKQYFPYAIFVILSLGIGFCPLWKFLMNKMTKRYTMIIGNVLMIPFLFGSIFFVQKYHIYIFFPLAIIASNSLSISFVVPWSMLPECMDYFEVKYGRKLDALFYTFFVLGTKILMSVYVGIGQIILGNVGGYKNNVCHWDQPKEVDLIFRILFATGPIVLCFTSTFCIYFYSIKENSSKQNTNTIVRMQEIEKRMDSLNSDNNQISKQTYAGILNYTFIDDVNDTNNINESAIN